MNHVRMGIKLREGTTKGKGGSIGCTEEGKKEK